MKTIQRYFSKAIFLVSLCAAVCSTLVPLAGQASPAGGRKVLTKGGIVLMLGASMFDLHEGDKRIEVVLKGLLEKRQAQAQWKIYNEAHGGEYIGPKEGEPTGVSEPLFSSETTGRYFEIRQRRPHADVIIINYGGNDSKVYPPATFRKKLEMLGKHVKQDFPGSLIIFVTTMYVDPKHSGPYHRDDSSVPGFKDGSTRNLYLDPYNQEVRDFTAARGYGLADVYRRVEQETRRGNWDLRVRGDGEGDPRDDPKHAGDMAWFENIHPNDQGTRIIAETLLEALLKSR
jgi:lysophospholipase L1-like esterase